MYVLTVVESGEGIERLEGVGEGDVLDLYVESGEGIERVPCDRWRRRQQNHVESGEGIERSRYDPDRLPHDLIRGIR